MKKKYIYPQIETLDSLYDFYILETSPGKAGTADMEKPEENLESKTFNFIGFEPVDDKK